MEQAQAVEFKKTKTHSRIYRFDLARNREYEIYHQIMQGHIGNDGVVLFNVKECYIGDDHLAFVECLTEEEFDRYYGGK